MREAEAKVVATEEAAAVSPDDPTLQARATHARLWRERVTRWCGLQRDALRADAVPVPGAPNRRWLLYSHGTELTATHAQIECSLCRRCASALRSRHADRAP